MANIAPANFAYVNANGDKGDVQVLSDADITLLNEGLQDIEDLKLAIQKPLPSGTLPSGTIIPFAGNVIPEGFLICNGAAVSRTTYASLFAAIGTLYGTGDGSTTFNLPDARDRVLQGASGTHSTGSYISAGLPNITGRVRAPENVFYSVGNIGALKTETTMPGRTFAFPSVSEHDRNLIFDASRSSAIYGASTTVQPSATAIQYLIKY